MVGEGGGIPTYIALPIRRDMTCVLQIQFQIVLHEKDPSSSPLYLQACR